MKKTYTRQIDISVPEVIRLWNGWLGDSSHLSFSYSLSLFWIREISSFSSLLAQSKFKTTQGPIFLFSFTRSDKLSIFLLKLFTQKIQMVFKCMEWTNIYVDKFLRKSNFRRRNRIKNRRGKSDVRASKRLIKCDLMWPNHAWVISYKIMVKFQNHQLNGSLW